MRVKWARLDANAVIPTIATDGSAGWDLTAPTDIEIPPCSQVIIPTGIACEIPLGWVGLIRGRSGFTKRSGAVISDDYIADRRRAQRGAGVIDADYRGEIGVMLNNVTKLPITIIRGQAFAQMVIVPCLLEGEEVSISELQMTIRGAQGYGHTGDIRG